MGTYNFGFFRYSWPAPAEVIDLMLRCRGLDGDAWLELQTDFLLLCSYTC